MDFPQGLGFPSPSLPAFYNLRENFCTGYPLRIPVPGLLFKIVTYLPNFPEWGRGLGQSPLPVPVCRALWWRQPPLESTVVPHPLLSAPAAQVSFQGFKMKLMPSFAPWPYMCFPLCLEQLSAHITSCTWLLFHHF